MNRSRLSRKFEIETKKKLFLSLVGIVIICFLLFKFGLNLLVGFSLFILSFKNDQNSLNTNRSFSFISPPVLNSLPSATNSAQISVSGIAGKDQVISLYLNDELIEKTSTKENGTFEFNRLNLDKGENNLKAKVMTNDKKESDFSTPLIVFYKDNPPTLTLESPSDNQSFLKEENLIRVTGKTDKDAKVTINDFWATVDSDGNFSYQLMLREGENSIKVKAIDEAGNKTEIERKVKYSL